jgi:hypothetical protein
MSDTESTPQPQPEPEPEPTPVAPVAPLKKKREGVKMSDKQKADLTKHMTKVGANMTVSERKSHRMKMMSRMRKGETIAKAHKALSS